MKSRWYYNLYNFAQKTQSIWFISYATALFLALATVLAVFDFLSIPNVTPDEVLLYSGILFAIGTGFGLGALESGERRLFWKWSLLWLVFILGGLILTLSGIYASFLDPKVMFDKPATLLFVIGTPLLVYGTILFFSGMSEETKDAFGGLWIVYLLFLLISLVFGFAGFGLFFTTDGGRNPISSVPGWDVMTEVAIVFGVLSIIPLGYVMGARESLKEKFHKAWIIWALLAVAGLVLFGLSVAEILSNVDIVGGAAHREGGLILGLAFQAPGFVFLLASTDKTDIIKKLSPLWVLSIIAGVVLAFASQLTTSLDNSTLGAGLGLVIIASGLLYKAISDDYSPTSTTRVARPARSTASSVAVSSKAGFDVPNDLPVEEKKIYIEMQRKTNENTIVSLNNYAKQNRLSKDFVTRKVQELQSVNSQAESLIASIVEEAKRSSRASLFEQAMGTETPAQSAQTAKQTPMSPPAMPSSPPAPINAPASKPSAPSGPPMPPPSSSGPPKPPGMPPMPPSGGAPPSPPGFGGSAGGPPKPPGMPPMPPGAAPPIPGGAAPPKAPGAPTGDAVGTARSTSIAELRGEMLKELRRLRDIFNEDQK